jgi:hypothetical protein
MGIGGVSMSLNDEITWLILTMGTTIVVVFSIWLGFG